MNGFIGKVLANGQLGNIKSLFREAANKPTFGVAANVAGFKWIGFAVFYSRNQRPIDGNLKDCLSTRAEDTKYLLNRSNVVLHMFENVKTYEVVTAAGSETHCSQVSFFHAELLKVEAQVMLVRFAKNTVGLK